MAKERNAHTSLDVSRGGLNMTEYEGEGFDFNTAAVKPVRQDPRYNLELKTLGRLERLAKARFLVSQNAPDLDISKLVKEDADTVRSIVLSVFASSEIEGEGVAVEDIEAFLAALTEPGEIVDQELRERLSTKKDIVDTYFWALNNKLSPVMPYDFVLEVHKRMFENSKKVIGGVIKKKKVQIRWQKGDGTEIIVPTVAADRAEQYLRALCDRTNHLFKMAEENADASMLLTVAEFACDLLAIHPFGDGNGRLTRLLSTYLLERGGYHFTRIYPLDQVVLDSRAEYYEALNFSQRFWHTSKEDLTPWVNYFVSIVFEQWERAIRRIRNKAT